MRADLSSREAAEKLADGFRAEGLPTVHRAKYLLIGANDEDQAKALATRVRREAPAGAAVVVEGTLRDIESDLSPSPFAFLGGLAI